MDALTVSSDLEDMLSFFPLRCSASIPHESSGTCLTIELTEIAGDNVLSFICQFRIQLLSDKELIGDTVY